MATRVSEIVFLRYRYGKGGLRGYVCIDKEINARNSAGCEGVSQSFGAVRYLENAWSLAQSTCLSCQPCTRFLSYCFCLKAAAERELEAACYEFYYLLPTIRIIKRCYRFPSDYFWGIRGMLFKTKKWTVIKPEEKLFIYILLAVKKKLS